jgi:hypothetical protein
MSSSMTSTWHTGTSGSSSPITLALTGSAAIATVSVAFVPQLSRRFVAGHSHCLLFRTTGWQCPLCGMTRATVALLHGDLGAALRLNAMACVYVTALVVAIISLARQRYRGRVVVLPQPSTRSALCWLAVLLTYALLRNVL